VRDAQQVSLCCRLGKCPTCKKPQPYKKKVQEEPPPLVTWTGRGDMPPGQAGRQPGSETAKVKSELDKDMAALLRLVRCLAGIFGGGCCKCIHAVLQSGALCAGMMSTVTMAGQHWIQVRVADECWPGLLQ
jgi:hypothetical protein